MVNEIYLKRVAEQDIQLACEIFLNENAWPYSETEAPEFNVLRNRIKENLDSNELLNFIIYSKNHNIPIGFCYIWIPENSQNEIEIACTILPSHRKNGYGLMVAKEMLRYGFENIGVHRITAVCNVENIIASRTLKAIGMRQEAIFVEKLYWNEKWVNQLAFAMLDREYFKM